MILSMMAGAGIVLVVVGGTGLAVAITTGGALGDSRAAFSASLVAIVVATAMVLAVGGLLVILLVYKLVRREFGHVNARMDEQSKTFRLLVQTAGDQLGARRNGDDPPSAQAH